jgi:hypothetical protein
MVRSRHEGDSTRIAEATIAEQAAAYFLIVVGLMVAALWLASLLGAFEEGLFACAGTDDAGNIPVFHLVAEGLMAMVAVAAGRAATRWDPCWWRGIYCAPPRPDPLLARGCSPGGTAACPPHVRGRCLSARPEQRPCVGIPYGVS